MISPVFATFLAVWLTAAYATYVVTRATLPPVARVRDWVVRRAGEGSTGAYLVTCPWCAGFYVSGLVTLLTWWSSDLALPALVWVSGALVSGFAVMLHDHLTNQQALDELTLESVRDQAK
jgi:hypothetical protein